jgi:sulfopyruvate decarboxylase TPP-binding subunit
MTEFFLSAGFGPFLAVPCGILAPLLASLEQTDEGVINTYREDNALAIACGLLTAGRRPLVLMQNSGLGQSINALASLVLPYGFPVAMVVSLRGVYPDTTEENRVMGSVSAGLLAQLGVTSRILRPATLREDLRWLAATTRGPEPVAAAAFVEPGFFGWSPLT